MTGKEILQYEFERSGMRGYKAEHVDAFMKKVAEYIDSQEQEKNDLTYKMKILADKIEEYKADEESIRDALLGAQKLGASILSEAKAKVEELTKEAKESAEEMVSTAKTRAEFLTKETLEKANAEINEIKKECVKEKKHLDAMKREVTAFRASLLKQYKNHLDLLSNLPVNDEKSSNEVDNSRNSDYKEDKTEAQQVAAIEVVDGANETSGLEKNENIEQEHEIEITNAQTIKSDVYDNEDEISINELEQTKEFTSDNNLSSSVLYDQDQDTDDFNSKKNDSKKNYIEKFGELKFGSYSK